MMTVILSRPYAKKAFNNPAYDTLNPINKALVDKAVGSEKENVFIPK
ncbi:hypothetical protein [uncultured Paraglaciecola sp.]|nr:hypothetical protein [uncultured Paraglaciecola sp.]